MVWVPFFLPPSSQVFVPQWGSIIWPQMTISSLTNPCTSSYIYSECHPRSESESLVAQLCPTLCNPMDCSLLGSSFHGIFQAIVLEWVAISLSRGSSQPREPRSPALQADFLPSEPRGKSTGGLFIRNFRKGITIVTEANQWLPGP